MMWRGFLAVVAVVGLVLVPASPASGQSLSKELKEQLRELGRKMAVKSRDVPPPWYAPSAAPLFRFALVADMHLNRSREPARSAAAEWSSGSPQSRERPCQRVDLIARRQRLRRPLDQRQVARQAVQVDAELGRHERVVALGEERHTRPVSTSPLPPLAMPGLPVGLTQTSPSGSAMSDRWPLSTTTAPLAWAACRTAPRRSRRRFVPCTGMRAFRDAGRCRQSPILLR